MRMMRFLAMMMVAGLLVAGCSQQDDPLTPQDGVRVDKDGTELLGEITIAAGTGFAEGGVGMVGTDSGTLNIDVPAGATVEQVFLYWLGGTTAADGDDEIVVDGNPVTGALIGGSTLFYENMTFYAYRADVTAEGWVVAGANSFTITGMDFDFTGNTHDENNGAGMIVIYDDGNTAELQLFDGLDMAFFKFPPTLNATAPVTFDFAAEGSDRTAQFVVLAGSVGRDRPNQIKVTTSAGDQVFDNPLGSVDGLLFDSITLDVMIPAGDTQLTAQMFSVVSEDPLGASLGWIGSGLSVPTTPPLYCLGDLVWYDENCNGCQDEGEMGVEGVEVILSAGCPADIVLGMTMTDADGYYEFCDLEPGDYTVQFMLPAGYEFSAQYAAGCGLDMDSNAGRDGFTDCVTIVDADDWTIDAGLCIPVEEGCSLTIGFWKTHAGLGNGNQDDVLSQYMPLWLGDDGGSKSYQVTDAVMAVDFLSQKVYGKPSNGITKLYAQMLAAKLNVAAGASDGDIATYLADADAFLADYNYMDWKNLSDEMKDDVMMWHDAFDDYNNGEIGPGHCSDDDDDDDFRTMEYR